VRWYRLYHTVEVDVKKVASLVPGFRIDEINKKEVFVTVSRGTALAGRPIHRWDVHLKGKRKRGTDTIYIISHWNVEEEHEALRSVNTMGFAWFFPEIVAPFETPLEEKRNLAQDVADELEYYSQAKKIKTRLGEFWNIHLNTVEKWMDEGYSIYFYKCPDCGQIAFTTNRRTTCSGCGAKINLRKISKKDIKPIKGEVHG